MSDGVIYKHSVEAFIQRVLLRRGLLSLEFDRELRALGVDASRPTEVTADVWIKLLKLTARRISPNKTEEEALEELGREQLRGYLEGLVGRAILTVVKLGGPQRTMLRMAENIRTADSITRVQAVELSPTSVQLEFDTDYGVQGYMRGLLHETLVMQNVKDPKVTVRKTETGSLVFTTSWSA